MAKKPDETIRLRNEGMAYALKIAREGGIEELERQVRARGVLKVSVKFTADELQQSFENLAGRIYNNMLTATYAVLHDKYGFRKKRLHDFKGEFDYKVRGIAERDPMGHHYVRFEDYALEANEQYDLGIDMEKIRETERINDDNDKIYIDAETAVKFLEKHGFPEAAGELNREVFNN